MRRIVLLSLFLTYIPLHSYAAPSDDALTVLNSLSVKGRAAKTGYTRANSLIGQILIAMVVMLEMTH